MAEQGNASAKINLTLHVTGQRADGYHLLDSLVVFASVQDRLRISLSDRTALTVEGPFAAGVPTDARNLVYKAASLCGVTADIYLFKCLPHAAGIGGGSADAAKTLSLLGKLTGCDFSHHASALGADVPVCLRQMATRMRGIGDVLDVVPDFPVLNGVLVNGGRAVPTADVFAAIKTTDNLPMPDQLPIFADRTAVATWLGSMRNDLEPAAVSLCPQIGQVLHAIERQEGVQIARMSGSGGTCFGLFETWQQAKDAAAILQAAQPDWWSVPCLLGPGS